MISGILFILTRLVQLFFLIPMIGMLASLVHGFVAANMLTPAFVLILFIVSVLAGAWVLATVLFYAAARHNGYLIAFFDLGIFGGLIAGVAVIGKTGVAGQSCGSFGTTSALALQAGIYVYNLAEFCNLLKASFALGIMEILFFFFSFWLALWVHHSHRNDDRGDRKVVREERRSTRRGSSRGGGSRYEERSRRSYNGPPRSRATSAARSYV